MRFQPLIYLGLLVPALGFAANREHEAMLRDLALLQEQVRVLQKNFDEKMAAVMAVIQQAINSADRSNTSALVLESKMTERLQSLEKSMGTSLATMGSKVDTMADEFRILKEGMADLNAKVSRLQTKFVDVENAVKTLREPPPPPPLANPAAGAAASGPPPGVTAENLYRDAYRDRMAAKYDLAMEEFQNYLLWFPNTDLACNAQFYVGDIHYRKKDLEKALAAFDDVLEKFPSDCNKRADAMYLKARVLTEGKQPTAAAQVYRQLLKDYPSGDWATRARAGLKELGYSTAAPPPAANRKRR